MADETVVNFRTPQEFIDYYGTNLKDELALYDIQINKLGFIGFLLNLLGHTSYDAKQYYDSLFKESFIATAQDTENLYFHAATYGYLPTFATPATADGVIVFDFASLPKKQSNVVRREVTLGSDIEDIIFKIEGYPFISSSKYKFVELDDQYFVTITSEAGQVQQIPFATSEIRAPFQNFEQFTTEQFDVSLPNYDFGSYYPYIIEIDEGHIADIKVEIRPKGTALYEQYNVNYVKYFEESFSKTVFLRKLTSQKFVIEFGSGVRGAYVPSSDVRVQVKITRGSKGNITKSGLIGPDGNITVLNYLQDGTNSSYSISAGKLTKVDFNYSADGVDPLSGDDLRNDVIAHIQSYDMLVDETDFINIASKYMSDFRFLFKKSNVQDNIFYLCRSFRNKYQAVVHTENLTFRIIEPDAVVNDTDITEVIEQDGSIEPEQYQYLVVPSDNFNNGVEGTSKLVDLTGTWALVTEYMGLVLDSDIGACTEGAYNAVEVGDWIYSNLNTSDDRLQIVEKIYDGSEYSVRFSTTHGQANASDHFYVASPSVELSWPDVANVQKYIVYRKKDSDATYTHFIETVETTIKDTGQLFKEVTYPLSSELVYFPIFKIEDKVMLSPFLYKYNSFMNWYDGFLLYDAFSVYFSESTSYITNFDIPTLYFFIEYDYLNKKSYIRLKSNQDISAYEFTLSINELSVYNENMTLLDNTTFQYEYSVESGILWESFRISINAFQSGQRVFSGISNSVSQVYDISDELVLLNFDHIVYVTPGVIDYIDPYILNIPLIDRDAFLEDDMYYLDKCKQFIYDADIKGKRMVSDNLQFRFLNTIKMSAFFAENFLVQAYTHDIIFPLKVSIEIICNQRMVVNQKINLTEKRDEFLILVADWLQKAHTSPDIKFYNSQIVDLIHTDRPWIKSVEVTVHDYNDTLITDGIETLSDYDGLQKIKDNKIDVVRYAPWLFYWDVDNIEIKMII